MKKRIFLSPPYMGELEQQFVRDAFDSNFIAPVDPPRWMHLKKRFLNTRAFGTAGPVAKGRGTH